MNVRFQGRDRVEATLFAAGLTLRTGARREVLRSALAIQAGAKTRCPVDTGRLRNSIAVELSEDQLSARVGTDVPYGPFVELGTRRMAARPYLFPAFEEERPRSLARLARIAEEGAQP